MLYFFALLRPRMIWGFMFLLFGVEMVFCSLCLVVGSSFFFIFCISTKNMWGQPEFFCDFGNFKQILIQRGATMQIFYNLLSQLQKYFDGKGQELSWIIWVWSKKTICCFFLAIGRMNIVQQNQIVLDRSQENELLLQNRSWMSFSLEVLWRNSFIQWEHFAMRGNKC